VGASLLAKTVHKATVMSIMLTLSRAGSLPQEVVWLIISPIRQAVLQ
jgi:hypothetical protein